MLLRATSPVAAEEGGFLMGNTTHEVLSVCSDVHCQKSKALLSISKAIVSQAKVHRKAQGRLPAQS